MPTTRFCQLVGIPERTWRRWQATPVLVVLPRVRGRSRRARPAGR